MSYSSQKTEVEKYSYCLGLDMASRVKSLDVEINKEAFLEAVQCVRLVIKKSLDDILVAEPRP